MRHFYIIALALVPFVFWHPDWMMRCPFTAQFLHANIFHLAANIWVLYCLSKSPYLTRQHYFLCYLLATACLYLNSQLPISNYQLSIFNFQLSTINYQLSIIGLSGLIYALLVLLSYRFHARARLQYHLLSLSFIALGFIIPSLAGMFHLMCYTSGLVLGLLVLPLVNSK